MQKQCEIKILLKLKQFSLTFIFICLTITMCRLKTQTENVVGVQAPLLLMKATSMAEHHECAFTHICEGNIRGHTLWVCVHPYSVVKATSVTIRRRCAFTHEYGWTHTNDVWSQMLPSQQSMVVHSPMSMGECTLTTYGHGCCLHNRVWVNTHPRCMATDVAFTKEYGWMHTHDVQPWMLPSLKARVPAHPQHSLFEFFMLWTFTHLLAASVTICFGCAFTHTFMKAIVYSLLPCV